MGASDNNSVVGSSFIVSRMDATEILNLAGEFVVQYYTVMKKCPSGLHRFYKDDSSMIHENSTVFGQIPIHDKIMSMNIHDSRVGILRLDALRANGNSVLIQVAGEISINDSEPRRFMQSFVLCEQAPCDFYVLNDIFRYQDHVFGDVKLDDAIDSAPSSPVRFQTEEVVRHTEPDDHDNKVAPWSNTVQSENIYTQPSMPSHEHAMNHVDVQHPVEPEPIVDQPLSTRPDSRAPSSPHPPSSLPAEDTTEAPTTKPCSWAHVASKQPVHGVLSMQSTKLARAQPGALSVQATDEQTKSVRPIPVGSNQMQRSRGGFGRPQPGMDSRSASGDHALNPEGRPSQGMMRGGRGGPGFGVRGTGRGGRGGGSAPMGGRGAGSFPRRGQ